MLEEKHLIGEGFHRRCFIHPTDDNLCVKVGKIDLTKEMAREYDYYKRLNKKQISWDCLSQYYGVIQTNIGVGYIYQLIKDDNNQPSKTLEHYLQNDMPIGATNALKQLENYLLTQVVITTSLKPRNIVLQKYNNHVKNAVIVDDIGNTEFIPLSNVSNVFARLKIRRKLNRLKKHLATYNINYC